MGNHKRCFFFWCSLISSVAPEAARASDSTSLRFVHALWRHGDRTPFSQPFAGDPNPFWPEGWGELTNVGIRQQYILGQYLRKRYVDSGFLSKNYNYSEIYVYSTNFNRTLMSATAALAGIYPPTENPWLPGLNWQPIPVHTKPRMSDPVVTPDRPCPMADNLFRQVMASEEVTKLKTEYAGFLNYIRNVTGFQPDSLWDIYRIFDGLNCEMLHNRTWPWWANRDVFANATALLNAASRYYAHDAKLRRLRGGLLFGEIAQRFQNKARNSSLIQSPTLKFYAYSAHDTTLIPQLEHLGAYDGIVPSYASVLLYELHEKVPGNFTVEVFYNKDQGATEPIPLTIHGCGGSICDSDTFVNMAKDRTPADWNAECGLGD